MDGEEDQDFNPPSTQPSSAGLSALDNAANLIETVSMEEAGVKNNQRADFWKCFARLRAQVDDLGKFERPPNSAVLCNCEESSKRCSSCSVSQDEEAKKREELLIDQALEKVERELDSLKAVRYQGRDDSESRKRQGTAEKRESVSAVQSVESQGTENSEADPPSAPAGSTAGSATRMRNREVLMTFLAVGLAMAFAAKVVNWFAYLWLEWIGSAWSGRELPMLFATVAMNSIVRSSGRRTATGPQSANVPAAEDAENDSPNNSIEFEMSFSSNVSAGSTASGSSSTVFTRWHIDRLRERFFETLIAFRLLIGFPLRQVFVRLLSTLPLYQLVPNGQALGVLFGPRTSFLLVGLLAVRFHAHILRFGLPLFFFHFSYLVFGSLMVNVLLFPLNMMWRFADCVAFSIGAIPALGRGLFGAVGIYGIKFLASSLPDKDLGQGLREFASWLFPAPLCRGLYFEAYSLLEDSAGLESADTDNCVSASIYELYGMLFSFSGVVHLFLTTVLFVVLHKLQVFVFMKKWLREGSLDDMENNMLAHREQIVEYAKNNPFRAKLHADPKQFLSAEDEQDQNAQTNGIASLVRGSFDNLRRLGEKGGSFDNLRRMGEEALAAGIDAANSGNANFVTTERDGRGAEKKVDQLQGTKGQEKKKSSRRSSLQTRVGARAKSSTCAERIAALNDALIELHGKPDTYDLLFKKVNIKVFRESKRRSLFLQVADQLVAHPVKRLKNGLAVKFDGEKGVDGGGLTAELLKLIAEELCLSVSEFDNEGTHGEAAIGEKEQHMLKLLPDATLMLAASSTVELVHYYALGRLVGLAILAQVSFPLPLSSAMLKMMADREIDSEDVRALDPVYFENRMLALLKHGGVRLMENLMDLETGIPFVWIDNEGQFGAELCSNGADIYVDEENKLSYLQLLSEHYVCGEVREQMQIFLSGFNEIVPASLLAKHKVDHVDLALALQGIAEVDVEDWMANTEHPDDMDRTWQAIASGGAFSSSSSAAAAATAENDHNDAQHKVKEQPVEGTLVTTSQLVEWFWDCVREMSGEQRLRLLQFSTARSAPPVGGFLKLKPRTFNLAIDPNSSHLPSSQTCFATLRLPVCASRQAMKSKLDKVTSSEELMMTFGES